VPAGVPIARLKMTERVIALSFDDGPQATPALDSVMSVLSTRHAHATFFVIGQELAAHPEIGRRLLAAGDELANHTWTHPRLDSISTDSMRVELARTDSLLHALGQKGRPLLRPPYAAFDERVLDALRRQHRIVALFDVDPSYDLPDSASVDSVVNYTLNLLGPGSILVLHPWYGDGAKTLATMPRILDRLIGMNYRLITVSQLFKSKHAIVEPSLYHEITP